MWVKICLVLVASVLTVHRSSAWAVTREKRSDDAGPLEVVVQHLSEQVSSLTAQLSSVHAELSNLKTKTGTLDKTVAFYAWNDARSVQAVAQGTLILNHAITNIGNAYDTTTGIFTVPVSGLYDFQASVVAYSTSDVTYVTLQVDNQKVAIVVSDNRHGYWAQPTMKAVVHLQAGQKVFLKNVEGAVKQYHSDMYTAFSGFLIKSD